MLPYITRGVLTMFPTSSRTTPYRQTGTLPCCRNSALAQYLNISIYICMYFLGIYKRVFTEIYALNESKWIAIIDLDEYMYSPSHVHISDVLRQHEVRFQIIVFLMSIYYLLSRILQFHLCIDTFSGPFSNWCKLDVVRVQRLHRTAT